jgi:hypothetical protein
VSAGVGKNMLIDAFTHPMILLTQNHYPSQEGILIEILSNKKAIRILTDGLFI